MKGRVENGKAELLMTTKSSGPIFVKIIVSTTNKILGKKHHIQYVSDNVTLNRLLPFLFTWHPMAVIFFIITTG